MKQKFSKKIFLFLETAILVPATAFAAGPMLPNFAPGAGATLGDFINMLIDIIQWVALPVLALCIIYAGFLLVTAGGDEKKVTSGKLWILWTLVGAGVILGAHVIQGIITGTASVF